MGNRVKSLVALGGSGLAGMAVAAFMFGTGALGQWGHQATAVTTRRFDVQRAQIGRQLSTARQAG